ncbi:zinc finger protein 761-like [Contarinia nasturtii]|uniref:zinc finger protein 761-like n=1 Tax=Contarinia nasturtii TaxID=265458 RepID=UPI0012D4A766|nr:zinc finger protein 761-like [Contarinia nasturtii]
MKTTKKNRCQCCNKTLTTDYRLVFGDEGKTHNIATLLHDYIGKSLHEQDGNTYAICDLCWQQLLQYNDFKQKCLRANEMSSDEEQEEDEEGEEEEVKDENLANTLNYEDSEYLDESQCDGDYEMKVEYLEENDFANEWDNEKKTIPFDFTSVLVKPIFMLEIDNADDLVRIKQKISLGIPRHDLKTKMRCGKKGGENLDVEKIATSDDLINILEDNYQCESSYSKKSRENDSTNDIDLINDAQPADISEYLKSIASITYEESYENFINCMLCSEEIMSQQHLIYHINESHTLADGVLCIFDENCPPFDDLVKVQEHIFHEHVDLIPTQLCLTCQTCENTFKSSVQFGKHMCLTIEDESTDFQCATCDKKLNSKKRYLFHTQFHLKKARPKICIICELKFEKEESFYNHVMFSHERVYEYFCVECDKSFSSNFRLELHIRSHHTKRTVQCSACDKTFVDKNMLDEHTCIRAQTEKSLECPVCRKVYSRSSRLRKHMTSHERLQENSVLICEPCSMVFGGIEDIDEHCNRSHDEDTVRIIKKNVLYVVCCEYCEFAFIDNEKLAKHKESHLNDEKPFKCGYCMACYETYSKLKTHKNTHLSQQVKFPVQRQYMCDVEECWKPYRHWSDLTNHRKTVHLINPSIYKCNDCEETFYQSWNFSYHKKTVHPMSTMKCDECDFECTTKPSLKSHQKRVHSCNTEPPLTAKSVAPKPKKKVPEADQFFKELDGAIVCNICEKQLASRNSARSHIEMIHLKVKNYACEKCGKEFYLKKDYIDHKRLHTAETPYECAICERKFRTASMLNEHRKSHSNNRPYGCPYCAATFKRAYVLKNHIKQHIGIKGFPCTVEHCKKEYRTQWELNSHHRLKHSKSDSNVRPPIICNQMDADSFDSYEGKTLKRPNNQTVNRSSKKKARKSPTKKKQQTKNQKIIYVMPGPVEYDTTPAESTETVFEKQTATNEDDHNYLAAENNSKTNVFYVVNPQMTSNSTTNEIQSSNMHEVMPTTILVCNPNFTIMDVAAIQTINNDETQARIS